MIQESAVCLDRRVLNPPAGESGGFTTWTLPYPVATDGSQGQVRVVNLDTEDELLVASRPSTTTVRVAGSYAGANVAVGISYVWLYVLSTIYYASPSGKPDRRAVVRLSYVRAFFSNTREVTATITAPDRDVCDVSLDEPTPSEGQTLSLPVFTDAKAATIELSSESPWPVRIGSMEWEGQVDPRSVTQVP